MKFCYFALLAWNARAFGARCEPPTAARFDSFKTERISRLNEPPSFFFFLLEEENKSINPFVAASGQIGWSTQAAAAASAAETGLLRRLSAAFGCRPGLAYGELPLQVLRTCIAPRLNGRPLA